MMKRTHGPLGSFKRSGLVKNRAQSCPSTVLEGHGARVADMLHLGFYRGSISCAVNTLSCPVNFEHSLVS